MSSIHYYLQVVNSEKVPPGVLIQNFPAINKHAYLRNNSTPR